MKSNRLSGTRAATGRNWFSQYDLCGGRVAEPRGAVLELPSRKMRYKPFKNAIGRIANVDGAATGSPILPARLSRAA